MKRVSKIVSYVLVSLLSVCLTLAVMGTQPEQETSKLEQLADLIQERFIGESDRTAMEDAAAAAMVDSLGDRWSYYLSAEEYGSYMEDMKNTYVGIGVTIQEREDRKGFTVVQVAAGGSAEEAGMLPGDIILAVEGRSVTDLGMDGAKNLIRGEEGTAVTLTVERDGQELTMTMARKSIITPAATGEMLENNIGLVTITNFHSRCAQETKAAIKELRANGAEKLIFDLRFNPGGYVSELVEVLDYLLPEGVLFRSQDYSGKESVEYSDAAWLDIPMAVLVNGESYSAAEFFAAAMREYDAAIVVGQTTCGKGYYQVTYQLDDGSAVGLSVGKYFTPDGVSLAGVGVTPDVIVEVDQQTMLAIYGGTLEKEEDPQIQAAVDALMGK